MLDQVQLILNWLSSHNVSYDSIRFSYKSNILDVYFYDDPLNYMRYYEYLKKFYSRYFKIFIEKFTSKKCVCISLKKVFEIR